MRFTLREVAIKTILLSLSFSHALLIAADEAHNTTKKREESVTKSGNGNSQLNCDGDAVQTLRSAHPLVYIKDEIKEVPIMLYDGFLGEGGPSGKYESVPEKNRVITDNFDAHASIWLAHALACPSVKGEVLFNYLDEEIPHFFTTQSGYNRHTKQWYDTVPAATYDNREQFLKTKELAVFYKSVLSKFAGDAEISKALSEQLLEFAKARLEKRDPNTTEALKKLMLELGKKFKEGKLNEITEAQQNLFALFLTGNPSMSEKLMGSHLTAIYRTLFLSGEPKIAKNGTGTYSTDYTSPKYILAGQGVLSQSVQNALNAISDTTWAPNHNVRNNPEDKSLFWKDPKNPVLIELQGLAEPQRSSVRKWARERFFAVQEGKVEGGDALTQEALVQIIAALEGTYDKDKRRVDKADFANTHNILSGQREKIAHHPDSWNLNTHADSFADRLKKTHGIELTEEARKNFLSLGAPERRVLLELAERAGEPHTSTLKKLLPDFGAAQVVDIVHANADARKSFYDQMHHDLDLSGDLKIKADSLIKDLQTADSLNNEATIKKAREIRYDLYQKLRSAVAEGKKGQAEAEALSRLINISDEIGLSQEQRKPLDATRNTNGQSHYSVPITLAKLEAEENALDVIHTELNRTVEGRGTANTDSRYPQLDALIAELYPKSMNLPSHTRALLAQLLLPENAAHLAMLRRLKSISEIRDGVMSQPQFRKVGDVFRNLLITPTPKLIEAMLKQYNPKAFDLMVQTQGEKHRQILLKKLMTDPEGFTAILRKMNEGSDSLTPQQAEVIQSLTQLGSIELFKQVGMLEGIVNTDTMAALPSNLALAARLTDPQMLQEVLKEADGKEQVAGLISQALNKTMGAILSDLIHEGSTTVLRGEGFAEVAKMSPERRRSIAEVIRKMDREFPEGTTSEEILAPLRQFNDVGLKVRSELNQLIGKTSPTPPVDLTIGDSLNGLIDRQLRRLSLDFNRKNREYEQAFNSYESYRTEHRLVGKDEWDKQLKRELYSISKKDDADSVAKRRKFQMDSFEQDLRGQKNSLDLAEKKALDAKDLKDLIAGKRQPNEGEVVQYTDLNQMRGRLNEMRKAYLSDMQEQAGTLDPEALKKHEQKLRSELINDYVASIHLPQNVTEGDMQEIRKNAENYLTSHWNELSHRMTEQGKRNARILEFVDKNYGAEIAQIQTDDPNETKLLREGSRQSYANMIRLMVNDAQIAKARVKMYAEASQEKFDSISPSLVGKGNSAAFEALASTISPEEGNSPKKLEAKATEFVDKHLKADLDKVEDPNARAQQRDFLISQLAKRLENKYTTGSTTRIAQNLKNWKDPYNWSLVEQLGLNAYGGHSIAYRPTTEEFNNEIVDRLKEAAHEQKKTDKETLEALGKLEAIGIDFNGSEVVLNGKSRINRAHLPETLVWGKEKEYMTRNGWQMCDKFDLGGDADMRQVCREERPSMGFASEGEGGHSQMLKALEVVNKSGIPLTVDHPLYKVTSLDGKGTMEDFMVSMFNQVNQGHNKYTLPLGENDAVILNVDPQSGQMTYELRNNKALSATFRKCMEEVAKKRDIHQYWTEKYGEFSTAFTTVMNGGKEHQRSKNMNAAWNEYVAAANKCSGYGAIDNGQGVTGQSFQDDEYGTKMNHQLALEKAANQKFEGNLNVIQDVAVQAAIFVGTAGLSSAVQGLAAGTRAALAAESMATLSYGQKLLYLAAQSERARRLMVAGLPILEKTGQAMTAASKAYRQKYYEGAKWAAIPLPFVYGPENYKQYKAWNKAEQLYKEGKYKAPVNADFKTEEEYKLAKKEWDELQERTDRNYNNIPDSLDGMGKRWITPDIAETHASLAGGGEFFGGMSAVHTLFPKMPGISYFSVFGGSMHSNMRDVMHGKKTLLKAAEDSAVTTLGMAPGLVFMNNAQHLIHKMPAMSTKIGLGMYGPTIGTTATAAGIHFLNKAGHHAGEWVGLSDPPPPETPWSEMSVGEKAAWAVNEAIGWKFAFDMAGASEMRHIARELGKAPETPRSETTGITLRNAKTPSPKASDMPKYEQLEKQYGAEKVRAAVTMMTPEELLNVQDPKIFNTAAAMSGKTPAQFREILELEHKGGDAAFLREFGAKDVPKVEKSTSKLGSYLSNALDRLKTTGNAAALVVDGQPGWTHHYEAMDKNYQNTIVSVYKASNDPAVQKKLSQFIVERPSLLAQMEARDLKFNATSSKTDGYMLESLANQTVGAREQTPFSQVPNAVNSGAVIDGKFHSVYGAGFAFYVKNRVQNGTAKELSVGVLLEHYHKAWERGEFTDVLTQMSRKASGASAGSGALVPVRN